MKKIFLSSLVVLGLSATIIIVSCKDKNNNNITPTYRNQSTGTGANPCLNCVTVTGTTTEQSIATQNSSLFTGGSGWSYNACATTPNSMTGFNGSTQVQILFGGAGLGIGTYAFTSGIPTSGQARMTVYNAPGQPEGITWYSKSGTVSTNTTTGGGYTASYSGIGCVQQNYLFPMVTVSGTLICQ
jgi:hypothetical protein